MEDKTSTNQSIQRSSLYPPSQPPDQPSSPLERLDPQRLREQAVASHLGSHSLQGHWSPASSTMNVNSPIRTPGSVQSPMTVSSQQGHHSSGSVDSLQQFTNQQQFFPANDGTYVQQPDSRTPGIQNPSPSRPQLSSPPAMIPHPQSPYVARTPNPSTGTPNPQFTQQPGQPGFHGMPLNSQQMYTTGSQNPAASAANTQRISYQIQPGATQYAYAVGQPSQHQPGPTQQQWIIQGNQVVQTQHFSAGQTRVAVQPISRVVQRLPPGYSQTNMVYANIPGSSAPQRIQVRSGYAQVVTTQGQVQQVIQQQPTPAPPRTPQTAQVPAGTPTTPAPGGQVYATGQNFPPNYQQPGQPTAFVQTAQVRPYPGNHQVQQSDPNHFATLATSGNTAAPRQAVPTGQVQQPMTVGHFPHQRGNPVNMRSPSIISPGQGIPMPQQQHMSRPVMRPLNPSGPTPVRPPHFVFDNNGSRVPPELCLAGCHFFLAECSGIDAREILTMVRYYGGDLEVFKMNDRVTHVIGEYITTNPISVLIERMERKIKICTLQWLNDVIEKKRVEPPYKACHLPGMLNRAMSLSDKVISVTGFTDKEMVNLKWMVQMIGAKFCPYLSKHTTFLVAKNASSIKVDKVSQIVSNNTIPIVNVAWLSELYMGSPQPLSNIRDSRFSVNTYAPLEIGPQCVYSINDQCARMMNVWQYNFPVTDEHIMRGSENRRIVLADESICVSNKYVKMFEAGPIPTQEQIDAAVNVLEKENTRPDVSIVLSGFSTKETELLSKKVRILGVKVVENVEEADFVIAPQQFSRTPSILKAIASGKDILSPLWIVNSFAQLQLVPTEDYFLQDTHCERTFVFNLWSSILSNRRQPIFKNTWFYVSPSVRPSRTELQAIIKCAGGKVENSPPSKAIIAKFIEVCFFTKIFRLKPFIVRFTRQC